MKSFLWILVVASVINSVVCSSGNARRGAPLPSLRKIPTEKLTEKALFQKESLSARMTTPPRGGQDGPKLRFAVLSGLLLAFNSGFINGSCLSGLLDGTKQGVAAVTGAYTTSALAFAGGNMDVFKLQIGVILSFMSGSTISGLLNPRPVTFQLSPLYGPSFLIGAVLLYVSSTIAGSGKGQAFLYLAAIANGIQNSITSSHTGNLVRTSHYTGISSDIGTFLGQVLRGNRQNLYKLKIFVGLAISFWVGGFVSFHATTKYASATLLWSAILYGLIGFGLIANDHSSKTKMA